MAKDATKIFGGEAKQIEISTSSSFASSNILGYASPETELNWEPVKSDTLSGQQAQTRGLGTFKAMLQQTDSTTLGYLKTARTTEHYVRVTDYNNQQYSTQVPMLLSYKPVRKFNGQDVHMIEVTGQITTQEPDDFCNFPA